MAEQPVKMSDVSSSNSPAAAAARPSHQQLSLVQQVKILLNDPALKPKPKLSPPATATEDNAASSKPQQKTSETSTTSSTANKSKTSKLPAAIKTTRKPVPIPIRVPEAISAPTLIVTSATSPQPLPSSSTPSPPLAIILEEGKELPVFWNGEGPCSSIKWTPSLDAQANFNHKFPTIQSFLAFYTAARYLRKCSMSLQASSTKYVSTLKMSDPFANLLEHHYKDGKPVTLVLTQPANGDDSESKGYAKFTLYIREMNGRRVLWNGSIPTNKLVAKLNQSDMGLRIENCLENYVAKGYLSENCQVDLVKECSDAIPRTSREELSPICMGDLVNTLFKGNSASIVIRSGSGASTKSCWSFNGNSSNFYCTANALDDLSEFTGNRVAVFSLPPLECHWIGKTWGVIKEDVRELVGAVEITMRDTILPTEVYGNVVEKKRALETAIRRRSRNVDEVWRCYQALRNLHNDVITGNLARGGAGCSSSSMVGIRTARNSNGSRMVVIGEVAREEQQNLYGNLAEVQQSCLDFFSGAVLRYGLELELYDEESQGLTRLAALGVGIAMVVGICTVVYYY